MVDIHSEIASLDKSLSGYGITNYIDRMIWFGSRLVSMRFGDSTDTEQLAHIREMYDGITYNNGKPDDTGDADSIVERVFAWLNSDSWHGEDVFQIMYEIIAVKQKSARGQVFTPSHIGHMMACILDLKQGDKVLDAACGTGSLLLQAHASGVAWDDIYGVEWDKNIYTLALCNILAHEDGVANIRHGDSTTDDVSDWIDSANITKVIMNPPYENKFGVYEIVGNVLESVSVSSRVAMLLPDMKLDKASKKRRERITNAATLTHVIKLPDALFQPLASVSVSLFIWTTGTPQGEQSYQTAHLENDGLVGSKNSVRKDIHNKWNDIEAVWLNAIRNDNYDCTDTAKVREPSNGLSYEEPEKPFEIYEEDFKKAAFDFIWFQLNEERRKAGLEPLNLQEQLMKAIYSGRLHIS